MTGILSIMLAVDALLDEVRLLWHAMARSGERLHGREPVTLGMRAVLEYLALHGPATVPHIARDRRVTRQHVQGLVNALVEIHLAAMGANPAHRRSALVHLTPGGRKVIERMKRREERFFDRIGLGRAADELERAAKTLRTVREAVEGKP
jgi:DNA-binding MarR family transcriptional regulator